MGQDGADGDLEVAAHDLPVHGEPRPPAGGAHLDAALVGIVLVDGEVLQDLLAQLQAVSDIVVGAVSAHRGDEPDLVVGDAGRRQFLQYVGGDLVGTGRAGGGG